MVFSSDPAIRDTSLFHASKEISIMPLSYKAIDKDMLRHKLHLQKIQD
jgi:hypothetical protein